MLQVKSCAHKRSQITRQYAVMYVFIQAPAQTGCCPFWYACFALSHIENSCTVGMTVTHIKSKFLIILIPMHLAQCCPQSFNILSIISHTDRQDARSWNINGEFDMNIPHSICTDHVPLLIHDQKLSSNIDNAFTVWYYSHTKMQKERLF